MQRVGRPGQSTIRVPVKFVTRRRMGICHIDEMSVKLINDSFFMPFFLLMPRI